MDSVKDIQELLLLVKILLPFEEYLSEREIRLINLFSIIQKRVIAGQYLPQFLTTDSHKKERKRTKKYCMWEVQASQSPSFEQYFVNSVENFHQ